MRTSLPTSDQFNKQLSETLKNKILSKKEVFQMIFKGEPIDSQQAFGWI
jgi:hypothetical protein